jgi:hypothetical protein
MCRRAVASVVSITAGTSGWVGFETDAADEAAEMHSSVTKMNRVVVA